MTDDRITKFIRYALITGSIAVVSYIVYVLRDERRKRPRDNGYITQEDFEDEDQEEQDDHDGVIVDGEGTREGKNGIFLDVNIEKKTLQLEESAFIHYIKENESINDRFEFGSLIGKGGFGEVFKCFDKKSNNMEVALKIIPISKVQGKISFLKEASMLYELNHPNILKIFAFMKDSINYYLITELVLGGELFDRIVQKGSLSEHETQCIMKELAIALKYLHDKGIAHRDLKPENILLTTQSTNSSSFSPNNSTNVNKKGRFLTEQDQIIQLVPNNGCNFVKLIDFGFSAKILNNKNLLDEQIGTPTYMSPEIIKKSYYGTSCDCWAFGIILYCMIAGYPPFPQIKDIESMFQNIETGIYQFNPNIWDSKPFARDLVSKLLIVDPSQRYTINQVLQHPWIHEMLSKQDMKSVSGIQNLTRRKFKGLIETVMLTNRFRKDSKDKI